MLASPLRRHLLLGLCLSPLFSVAAANARQAPRVASLDWALAETLVALGHPPIAVNGASDWSNAMVEPPLPSGITDLGLQQEIDFELLAMLRPDLILTSPFLQNLEPTLARIAPTLRLSVYEDAGEPLQQRHQVTLALGARLNLLDRARSYLADAEAKLDGFRDRIARTRPRPVLMGNFIDGRHIRIYAGSSLYQNVLARLGIENAWSHPVSFWGYATVGIEQLATAQDVQFISFEPLAPDVPSTLAGSPLWTELPFVRAGHTGILPTTFMFGAMPSALRIARLLTEHFERIPA